MNIASPRRVNSVAVSAVCVIIIYPYITSAVAYGLGWNFQGLRSIYTAFNKHSTHIYTHSQPCILKSIQIVGAL